MRSPLLYPAILRESHTSSDASPATPESEGSRMDVGNLFFGGHEALVIFDRVFVPLERIFMLREHEYAGSLVEKFASYHRQSYACKVGVGDVLIGAAQTIAEYNGAAKASTSKTRSSR